MSKFWTKWKLASVLGINSARSEARRVSRRRPLGNVELMEERTLLSNYSVTNTLDSGDGTLRAAILQANENPGADTISFNIATGIQLIQPTTALPVITDPVTIDGTTQVGFDGVPLIIINGDLLAENTFVDGLVVDTTDSLIKGLVINGFDEGVGIVIGGFGSSGVARNRVEGSFIGLTVSGATAAPNADGIRIANGAIDNVIGGVGAAGNVISGNTSFGVLIQGAGTTGNRIIGNAIGTSSNKTAAIANGYGVAIGDGATQNDIGGVAAGEGNLISGNTNNAIYIAGAATSHNQILGNRIGTNASGTAALGDFTDSAGILLSEGTHDNTIGGTTVGARNQIAGLSSDGVLISDATTHNNVIQGNYFGVSADGLTAISNGGDNIYILNSSLNTIGGDSAAAGNVISGAVRNGITINGATATGNIVWANLIGTNATGLAALPNAGDGVTIDGGANGNLVGGSTPVRTNLISGNTGNGISLTNASASNSIQGNLIGIAADAVTALPNQANGIAIDNGAIQNVIGGSAAGAWNFIAFNGFKGIEITGATTQGNTIRGNRIFSNQDLAIDLNGDGVTANDPQDSDSGPGGLQNKPVLTSANAGGGLLFAIGTLNSKANSTYILEFYTSSTVGGDGTGQGATPIATLTVDTNASGNAPFTAILPITVTPGQFLTVTATDDLGNTSEFSAASQVGTSVPPNPILTLSAETVAYQFQQSPVIVNATAGVTDPDSTNFNKGKLTVSLNSKGERGEKLSVRNQGDGDGQIGLQGKKVKFQGVVIGKLSGGTGKKPLTITFNANATPAIAARLLENITYSHTGKTTALTSRTLKIHLSDDGGHFSNTINKTVNLTVLVP